MFLHDCDWAMIELCSELPRMPPASAYRARRWPMDPATINQWGGPLALRFIAAGYPAVAPDEGAPSRPIAGVAGRS